jgi:hypothetical protein
VRQHWGKLMDSYFRRRQSLAGLFLVMDARRPLTEFDQGMLGWAREAGCPVHILLTKADKLSRGAAAATLLAVQQVPRRLGHRYNCSPPSRAAAWRRRARYSKRCWRGLPRLLSPASSKTLKKQPDKKRPRGMKPRGRAWPGLGEPGCWPAQGGQRASVGLALTGKDLSPFRKVPE